ncbi:TetR/AcrR family transcriptional regulator [Euzebya sp.]|uniref:TetR/AcrR family transcriptional regulator n=1 Tax=Euzebya sp. TaxID=1971409 RepID=UPI00351474CA
MRSTDEALSPTAVRIRDAAIECFAEDGVAATTVRAIAQRAEVSPGLVIHHFGSKDALRVVCDTHVAAVVREGKSEAMSAGLGIDVMSALRRQQQAPVLRYLAKTLSDGTPEVTHLLRTMVADAAAYMSTGVDTGILGPIRDPHGVASVITIWSLGALVLHSHVEALLGVDILADDFGSSPAQVAPYFLPALEVLSGALITPEAAAHLRAAFDPGASDPDEEDPDGR